MKTSVDVHNLLQDKGVQHEIFLLDSPARTAERAAALLQLKLTEVVKSVMFFARRAEFLGGASSSEAGGQADKEPILVLVAGEQMVSYKKLKKILRTSHVSLADAQSVVDATGYVIGATPPLAHQKKMRTLIDTGVMELDMVYTGGGGANAILKMKPKDLQALTNGEVVDVAD